MQPPAIPRGLIVVYTVIARVVGGAADERRN